MQNLTFMLRVLLFPVSVAVNSYVYDGKLKRRFTKAQRGLSAVSDLVTWLAVAYLLYGS